jgi:hypothetical protein
METLKTMSTAVSTNLDDAVAARAREIAQREPRSISNLVANAVAMFTKLPKELGDGLLQLRAINDEAQLRTLAHEMIALALRTKEMMALAARTKFDRPVQEAVKETRLPTGLEDAEDLETLEAAMAITLSETRHRG